MPPDKKLYSLSPRCPVVRAPRQARAHRDGRFGVIVSMDETDGCVLDHEGVVVRESKRASTAKAIADELAKTPSCHRIVFETGRMVSIVFHGLSQLSLPVVRVESPQAFQALESLAAPTRPVAMTRKVWPTWLVPASLRPCM